MLKLRPLLLCAAASTAKPSVWSAISGRTEQTLFWTKDSNPIKRHTHSSTVKEVEGCLSSNLLSQHTLSLCLHLWFLVRGFLYFFSQVLLFHWSCLNASVWHFSGERPHLCQVCTLTCGHAPLHLWGLSVCLCAREQLRQQSLKISLYLSLFLPVFFSVHFPLPVSLSLYLSLSFSLSVCLSYVFSVCLSIFVILIVCLLVSLPVSFSLTFCLAESFCRLSICLSACLLVFDFLSVYRPVCLSATTDSGADVSPTWIILVIVQQLCQRFLCIMSHFL